jgi:hypothetical protein
MLRNIDGAPWEVLPENLGVPSINARKRLRRGPWEVLPENPGVLTINARKHRWRPPLGGVAGESSSAHHQR